MTVGSAAAIETIKAHCPSCGGERKSLVRCKHVAHWSDDQVPIDGSKTTMILECCGCETVFVRVDEYFSEDVSFSYHPLTNELILESNIVTKYWPSPTRRVPPAWAGILDIADETLRTLLNEMYNALNSDLRILAAIAARTTIDRASEILGVPAQLSFAAKLDLLVKSGKISIDERDTLAVLIDAGSAAAHRGWRPTAKELDTMMDVTESFLHRALILGDAIAKLREAVPPKTSRGS